MDTFVLVRDVLQEIRARAYAESLRNPPLPLRRGGASDTAPAPARLAEIGGDGFPVLHLCRAWLLFVEQPWLSFTAFSARVRRRVFGNADHSGADQTLDRAGAAQE